MCSQGGTCKSGFTPLLSGPLPRRMRLPYLFNSIMLFRKQDCCDWLKWMVSVSRHCWSTCRSGHGGSVRGDDDTCSLPTTTWSGQQTRTPIAIRRLGPLQPAPSPHHQPPAKPRAWLARVVKLAALGAVVAISAAGVIKVSLLSCVIAHMSASCICLHEHSAFKRC